MRNIISLLLASMLLIHPKPGWSQGPSSPKEAKAAYEEGARHYDLAEYAEALGFFKDAYRAKTDAAFLFNIAQCLRKLGRRDEAATFYRTYLRRAPDAANRAEVERHVKDIEDLLAASSPPATRKFSPQDIPIPPEPRIDLSPRATPPIDDLPIYKAWWFWAAAGALAAGTTAAVIIMARHDPTTIPSSILGSQRALP